MQSDSAGLTVGRALVCLGSVLVLSQSARALTDEAIFRDFRYDFMTPGVQAPAMGGASVAVSNDVSAMLTNPAGLHYVRSTQLFAEYRVVERDPLVTGSSSGSLAINAEMPNGDLPFLGLTNTSNPERVDGPSFLGFAGTLKLAGTPVTIAGSRQVLLWKDASLTSDEAGTEARFAFEGFPPDVVDGQLQIYSVSADTTGNIESEIAYWNLGASVDVSRDFSFGVTVSYATLDMKAHTRTVVEDPEELVLPPSHPRLPSTPTSDVYETGIDGTDDALAWSVGIDWHPNSVFADRPSPWRFGVAYTKGASFEVPEAVVLNGALVESLANTVKVPDRYAVGVSYRMEQGWTFAGELERIEFSDLLEGFQSGVNYVTSEFVVEEAFGTDPDASIEYNANDGWVSRLGIEYLLRMKKSAVAFRAGYYRVPDGGIEMTQFNSDDPEVNAVYLDAFRGGESENHVTAGVGYAFGRASLQIAADLTDDGYQGVGSFLYSFGKTEP